MNMLARDELKMLAEQQAGLCVSVYMPMHRSAAETQQDQIRLKNLLREAEKRLLANGVRSTQAKELLEPAQQILADSFFWRHPGDGLALFLSPHLFRCYRLPLEVGELLIVSRRFHLLPLLPLLSGDDRFYILALSRNQIRLWHGTRFGVGEVELRNVPASLAEALKEVETEKERDYHQVAAPVGAGRVAISFGNAAGTDDSKVRLLEYFHKVDDGLREMFGDGQLPLVLAGVDYLFPIYREANTHPHLLSDGIAGSPKELGAKELHARAWVIVQPYFEKKQQEAVARYEKHAGGERASGDLEQIIPAASQGRVELLLVARGLQVWGAYHTDASRVDLHKPMEPGDDDLLNIAAIQTFLNGGTFYLLEREKMPEHVPVAAVFRY